MISNSIRARQVILLAGLLLIEGRVPAASIAFLAKSYLDLSGFEVDKRGITTAQMAINYGCTPQAGRKHAKILGHHNLLQRAGGSKRWKFNWDELSRLNNLASLDI
jgi:hypothetical protein